MGDVNLEIKLSNLDERVIKIEESGGGSGGDDYITSVSNDFNVVNKKLSLSNDITTKLSKVDTTDNLSVELAKKIDKPASATNGQVLTYNGTSNEWEAQDSKGGADDTSIISDAYDELKTYVVGEYCIYNNSLWKCLVQNNGQTPTEGTYWTNVTVANEIVSVNSSLSKQGQYEVLGNFNSAGTFTLNKSINDFNYICMITRNEHATIVVETLPSKFVGMEIFNLVYNAGSIREVDLEFLSSSSVNIFTFSNVSEFIILGFD